MGKRITWATEMNFVMNHAPGSEWNEWCKIAETDNQLDEEPEIIVQA